MPIRKKKTLAVRKRRYARKAYKKYNKKKSHLTGPLSKRYYSYRETLKSSIIVAGGGGVLSQVWSPSYSNINGYVGGAGPNTDEALAYQNLYDEYMLWKFTVEYRPRIINPDQTTPVFDIFSVIDYNDTGLLATSQLALEYADVRKHKSADGFKRTVYPRIPMVITDTSSNPFITPSKPRWISTVRASQIVPHLGLKVRSDTNTAATAQTYDIYLNLYFKFRVKY